MPYHFNGLLPLPFASPLRAYYAAAAAAPLRCCPSITTHALLQNVVSWCLPSACLILELSVGFCCLQLLFLYFPALLLCHTHLLALLWQAGGIHTARLTTATYRTPRAGNNQAERLYAILFVYVEQPGDTKRLLRRAAPPPRTRGRTRRFTFTNVSGHSVTCWLRVADGTTFYVRKDGTVVWCGLADVCLVALGKPTGVTVWYQRGSGVSGSFRRAFPGFRVLRWRVVRWGDRTFGQAGAYCSFFARALDLSPVQRGAALCRAMV